MSGLLIFAFISGIITILSPCILPVLPVVLAGSVGRGKRRPIGVIVGFIMSFATFTLVLTAIVEAIGIPAGALRSFAVVFIIIMGMTLLVPKLRTRFELIISRLSNRKTPVPTGSGLIGGFFTGVSLGLVWTPCVGPIMASVVSLALTRQIDGGAILITIAYTIGTAIPMIGILFGGRAFLTRVSSLSKHGVSLQRGFGVLMVLAGLSIGFGLDLRFQSAFLSVFPNYGSGLTAIENSDVVLQALDVRMSTVGASETAVASNTPVMMMSSSIAYDTFDIQPSDGKLRDYGPAPELVGRGEWLNAEGLGISVPNDESLSVRMVDLRGKVVLIDFWTYSCVNCIRTIPYLERWHEMFGDDGLVIIGVHTPEFEFEKSLSNLSKAMKKLGVVWPVVQDNQYLQWRAYNNRYWPAKYFIDAEGHLRYFHFGEGEYDTSERVIRALLREAGMKNVSRRASSTDAMQAHESNTPETYLGYGRADSFSSVEEPVLEQPALYSSKGSPANGEWNLEGQWRISREYVSPIDSGVLSLGFHAKRVFLVIEPGGDRGSIDVYLDDEPARDTADVISGTIVPEESRLYELVNLEQSNKHILRLEVRGDMRLFAFTFG